MRAESTAGFILGHTARSTDRGTTVGIMEFETPRTGRALVVIVDDRVAHGDNPDSAGPLVTELLAEAGVAGYDYATWYAFVVPAATPAGPDCCRSS